METTSNQTGPDKAKRNAEATLRQKARGRSLVNWGTYRLAGSPINYTPENRRAIKEAESEHDLFDPNAIMNKSKRKRMKKMADRIEARGQNVSRELVPVKYDRSRQERRHPKT